VRRATTISALLLSAAAATSANAQSAAVTRDSAGIRIVTNPAGPPAAAAMIRVDTHPLMRVGFDDNGFIFETVEGAALLSDGGVVVSHRGSVAELVVLSPSGSVVRKLGRKGLGPGEFQMVREPLVLPGDTILMIDPQARRYVMFHDARVVREASLGPEGNLQALGTTTQGKLMLGPWLGIIFGRIFPTPWNSVPLAVMDIATRKADTVGMVDQEQSLDFGGRNPFKSQGAFAVSRGMFVVGRTDAPELRFIDATGKLRQIARWQATRVPVHDTIWRNYSTRYARALRERPGGYPEDLVQAFVGPQVRDGIREPLPYFATIVSDADGNIWVPDYAPRFSGDPPRSQGVSRRFRVMSPSGQWIAELRIPDTPHFREYHRRVLAIGKDRLVALEADSLGVSGIAAYRLIR
jgi:hypothetical protein